MLQTCNVTRAHELTSLYCGVTAHTTAVLQPQQDTNPLHVQHTQFRKLTMPVLPACFPAPMHTAGRVQGAMDGYILPPASVQPAVPAAQSPAMAQPSLLFAQHASTAAAQQPAGLARAQVGRAQSSNGQVRKLQEPH